MRAGGDHAGPATVGTAQRRGPGLVRPQGGGRRRDHPGRGAEGGPRRKKGRPGAPLGGLPRTFFLAGGGWGFGGGPGPAGPGPAPPPPPPRPPPGARGPGARGGGWGGVLPLSSTSVMRFSHPNVSKSCAPHQHLPNQCCLCRTGPGPYRHGTNHLRGAGDLRSLVGGPGRAGGRAKARKRRYDVAHARKGGRYRPSRRARDRSRCRGADRPAAGPNPGPCRRRACLEARDRRWRAARPPGGCASAGGRGGAAGRCLPRGLRHQPGDEAGSAVPDGAPRDRRGACGRAVARVVRGAAVDAGRLGNGRRARLPQSRAHRSRARDDDRGDPRRPR